MQSNEQGLAKEEKVMFIILGIILLIAIGVLIINSFSSNDRNLDNNETPITENNGQKDEIVEEEINESEEDLIEEESEEIVKYLPIVNNTSSQKENLKEDQSSDKEEVPKELTWTFKNTMVTQANDGDIIIIEKNVLLSDGTEAPATITIKKEENNEWITISTINDSFQVTEGTYKYIYSYGSNTKELLLIVTKQFTFTKINFLKLNDYLTEESTITQEDYDKLQLNLANARLENIEGINTLTVDNYRDTNNYLPLVLTSNEDLTSKIITTTTNGVSISTEPNDWHEELTPKSMIIWLDLNTIDLSNNIIDIIVDGVTYSIEQKIVINHYQEDSSDIDQGELDNDQTEDDLKEETGADTKEPQDKEDNEENKESEEEEDNIEPTEPPIPEDENSSSNDIECGQETEDSTDNLETVSDTSTETS